MRMKGYKKKLGMHKCCNVRTGEKRGKNRKLADLFISEKWQIQTLSWEEWRCIHRYTQLILVCTFTTHTNKQIPLSFPFSCSYTSSRHNFNLNCII